MNLKAFAAVTALFAASILPVFADGFIIITEKSPVPGGHYPFAPLEVSNHHVEVSIDGRVATTTVDQEFYNPNDQRLEGTYLFPVPKDAHIDKFSMEVNGKMTDAELLPADKARQIYEDIVRKMRDPALLEYNGRDVFKARIFPIEPKSRKQVKIVYSELLKSDAGALTYTYPLSTEKFSSQPIKSLSIKVDVSSDEPLASIYSPSHKIDIKRDGASKAVVGYEANNEKPDTDFQLVLTREKGNVGLHLMSYKEADSGYFLLLAAPTPETNTEKSTPKDVVFVLDTSGSMAGEKIKQAKKALDFCVQSLNDDDRFEIIRFSTQAEPLFNKLTAVTDDSRKQASKFISKLKASGGTAIAEALKNALGVRPEKNDRPFVVIFLTDGMPTVGPTKIDDILDVVKDAKGGTRIFSFGIGSDVNTNLLDQLAESTRAFSQYVLPEEDIEVKVSNFFTRIKEPAITNMHLEFADASGKVVTSQLYPKELPDLFKGDELVLTGRYTGSGDVTVKLTGQISGKEQSFSYKAHFDDHNTSQEFIPRLWATRRVAFLLDEIRLHGENNELRDEATSLAREFGIVTPYTAYLIVEDEERRNVPAGRRSMQEMNRDSVAMAGARAGWNTFKDLSSGQAAVGNAQSQNSYKFATTVSKSSMDASNAQALGGGVGMGEGRGGAESAKRLARYTQQTKFVNGRAFFQNGNQWVDGNAQKLTKHEKVQFNSDAYFALLAQHPEAAPWFALGQNVQIALGDTVYEISE